jgi:uncharacterized protein (TIGR04255 family)
MKIDASERVVYAHNPLAEVVCQVQFDALPALTQAEVAALQARFSTDMGHSVYQVEELTQVEYQVTFDGTAPAFSQQALPANKIHHFLSADGFWRVSFCATFMALTCLKYSKWEEFRPVFFNAIDCFGDVLKTARVSRVGLRYKDVIEREPLGLAGVAWHELIKPFMLGPLNPDALADEQTLTENDIGSLVSQYVLHLESCKLLLQSSLLMSLDGQRKAFLIDMDFFNDHAPALEQTITNRASLIDQLNILHGHAGDLFRRCIKEKLHDALRPAA